jgi:hypothetical protein
MILLFWVSLNTKDSALPISAASSIRPQKLLLFIGISSSAANHPLRSIQRDIFSSLEIDSQVTIKFMVDVSSDMPRARKELLKFEVTSIGYKLIASLKGLTIFFL